MPAAAVLLPKDSLISASQGPFRPQMPSAAMQTASSCGTGDESRAPDARPANPRNAIAAECQTRSRIQSDVFCKDDGADAAENERQCRDKPCLHIAQPEAAHDLRQPENDAIAR